MNTIGLLFAQAAEETPLTEGGGDLLQNPVSGGGWQTLAPIILMIAVFYFLLIRPQQKKEKERRKMISALKTGDKVLTVGGIYGVVSSMKGEDVIVLKISDSSKVEVARSAIQAKIQ